MIQETFRGEPLASRSPLCRRSRPPFDFGRPSAFSAGRGLRVRRPQRSGVTDHRSPETRPRASLGAFFVSRPLSPPNDEFTIMADDAPTENRILIFDTTLRDGEQSPGASMTHLEKVE